MLRFAFASCPHTRRRRRNRAGIVRHVLHEGWWEYSKLPCSTTTWYDTIGPVQCKITQGLAWGTFNFEYKMPLGRPWVKFFLLQSGASGHFHTSLEEYIVRLIRRSTTAQAWQIRSILKPLIAAFLTKKCLKNQILHLLFFKNQHFSLKKPSRSGSSN